MTTQKVLNFHAFKIKEALYLKGLLSRKKEFSEIWKFCLKCYSLSTEAYHQVIKQKDKRIEKDPGLDFHAL